MSTNQQRTSKDVVNMLTTIGKALPARERFKGTDSVTISMVPTGEIKVSNTTDSFVAGKVDVTTNNLEGKKVVLLFGRFSHPLTRTFLAPKMAVMYHHLTLARNDVEFLYVSLDEIKVDYDKFVKLQPWPAVPWKNQRIRHSLAEIFHGPLKKKHGAASVVVLDASGVVITRDAEPYLTRTHDETGKEFPWQVSTAENCCAAGATLLLCNIL